MAKLILDADISARQIIDLLVADGRYKVRAVTCLSETDRPLTRIKLVKLINQTSNRTLIESDTALKKYVEEYTAFRDASRLADVRVICELLMNKRLSTREALEEAARRLNLTIET